MAKEVFDIDAITKLAVSARKEITDGVNLPPEVGKAQDVEPEVKKKSQTKDPEKLDKLLGEILPKEKLEVKKKAGRPKEPEDDDRFLPTDEEVVDVEEEVDELGEEDDDDDEPEFDTKDSDSDKFKNIVASQKEYKTKYKAADKELRELRAKVADLEPLTKYRDIVDAKSSPEWKMKFNDYRAGQHQGFNKTAMVYGVKKEQLEALTPVFEQENAAQGIEVLNKLIQHDDANKDLRSFVINHYSNLLDEKEALEVENPRASIDQIRDEMHSKLDNEKVAKKKSMQELKSMVANSIKIDLNSDTKLQKYYPALVDERVKQHTEIDSKAAINKRTVTVFEKLCDEVIDSGAEVSPKLASTLAILAAAHESQAVYEAIIPELLDRLDTLKGISKRVRSNDNPSIREKKSSSTSKSESSREDKVLTVFEDVINKRLGR